MEQPVIDSATPAADIARYIETIRKTPSQRDVLVDLLAEQSPVYAGRSTNEAERLRGYLLASFEATGLPPAALAYVCEELESGRNPYTVAAAAKALRGADVVPEEVVPLLLAAIERIRPADDAVSFDTFSPASARQTATTALVELVRTLAWLGPRAAGARDSIASMLERGADGFSPVVRVEIEHAVAVLSHIEGRPAGSCCAGGGHAAPAGHQIHAMTGPSRRISAPAEDIQNLELQDQEGVLVTFGELFYGRPSIIAFFYTRCMNPDKCSLTITKLARLQGRIREDGLHDRLNVAALTYDPAFDLPHRLLAYGADRGMTFDDRNRLLRTTGPFEPVQRHFDLGVGYGNVTVNRHRLDLIVLDSGGNVAASFTRRLWGEDDVLAAACRM